MNRRAVIPFGPQHPVLLEPIHLDLVLEEERVVEAIPAFGFVHRGLELLCRKKTFSEMISVSERICGICSFVHGMGPSQALEKIMGVEVPERALFLRVFWSELSRIQSHLLWLGLAADACGFESLFMNFWRIRESVLDVIEATTGGRIIFGACRVGGVRRDVADAEMCSLGARLDAIEADYRAVAAVFLKDATIASRLDGVAVLARDEAHRLGAVGPTARGSGLPLDLRRTGYAAYSRLAFEPVVETGGDAMARGRVRAREGWGRGPWVWRRLVLGWGQLAVGLAGRARRGRDGGRGMVVHLPALHPDLCAHPGKKPVLHRPFGRCRSVRPNVS